MKGKNHYDIIVIGAGPAGEAAAMNAKKKGHSVAVINDLKHVGGNCTHWATIPSKALRHAVNQVMQFNANPMFRDVGEAKKLSFQQIQKLQLHHFFIKRKIRTGEKTFCKSI